VQDTSVSLGRTGTSEVVAVCCNLTSGTSSKVVCSRPSAMVERFWVGGWFWA
jgi:hypothetical protein